MSLTLLATVALGLLAQQSDTVVAVLPGTRLDVDVMRGNVVVRTWDRNEVRVVGQPSSDGRLEVRLTNGTLQVRSVPERGGLSQTDVQVTVPRAMNLGIQGTFLSVDVSGARGEVTVETTHGNIQLVGGRGFVSAQSVQGTVTCRDAEGRLELGSTNGHVEVSGVSGTLKVESVNGGIELRDVRSGSVEASTVNGGIAYGGTLERSGRYQLSTHNGDVAVDVPAGTNATIAASTFGGAFESDFPVVLREAGGGGRQITITLGDGGARLELSSFNGSIHLRRP
ncbi:MAG: DUF4097 domain-containing protein [Gemmatimonadota bacterium]|nr:DUF4097 domain-containing protein [Gemmatimonadota bacterium]MDH3477431.1 DUF4097 domain-containing protein [Gemmatimonadota bacterium]MDH3569566.1 DUF4097 domain-containing protein [Gemmatimonadota bacterium]MDH5549069.1 DUF4097 domain-containing protein [Gemmatimonadota bacterium]